MSDQFLQEEEEEKCPDSPRPTAPPPTPLPRPQAREAKLRIKEKSAVVMVQLFSYLWTKKYLLDVTKDPKAPYDYLDRVIMLSLLNEALDTLRERQLTWPDDEVLQLIGLITYNGIILVYEDVFDDLQIQIAKMCRFRSVVEFNQMYCTHLPFMKIRTLGAWSRQFDSSLQRIREVQGLSIDEMPFSPSWVQTSPDPYFLPPMFDLTHHPSNQTKRQEIRKSKYPKFQSLKFKFRAFIKMKQQRSSQTKIFLQRESTAPSITTISSPLLASPPIPESDPPPMIVATPSAYKNDLGLLIHWMERRILHFMYPDCRKDIVFPQAIWPSPLSVYTILGVDNLFTTRLEDIESVPNLFRYH
jgi:hypothetical protein